VKIEHYSFGKITIDGKTFTSDLIIYPNRINHSWWRKEGHLLQIDDLQEVLNEDPEIIVIGTGYSGIMKVNKDVILHFKSRGIKVIVEKTPEAAKIYNELSPLKKTIACLHLTC
jgi:hypothetical protein